VTPESVSAGLARGRAQAPGHVHRLDRQSSFDHYLWEIIDNSVDEALGGYCDHIEVILRDDGSVEVWDSGRGNPVDVKPKTGCTGSRSS
jgi:DNA gyrase/topoisomerase IV subunit B